MVRFRSPKGRAFSRWTGGHSPGHSVCGPGVVMSVSSSRNDPSRRAQGSVQRGEGEAQGAVPASSRPGTGTRTGTGTGTGTASGTGTHAASADRTSVVAREKERYGGIKWGSAFFGWLTATGTAVILTALLVAAGAAVGVSTGIDATDAQKQAGQQAGTIGLVGGITLLVVIFVAYFSGGYVAGRMARFNGVRQGVAVW